MSDLQLPEWLADLSMKVRNKIIRLCDKTVLCIASGTRGPLTENQVVTALEMRRAVVLHDERPGHYWVRGSDSSFLDRIRERGLPGFSARQIDRNEEEWVRLAGIIGDSLGLRNVSGPFQPQTSVEHHPDDPSTSGSAQLQVAENVESGSSGGESTHASTAPPPEERPRKRQRVDHEVSTTNSADKKRKQRKQRRPPLDIIFARLPPELVVRILELCFKDEASCEEHNFILEELASQGGRCLQALEGISSLWTRITSTSPKAHIDMALQLSQQHQLRIEGGPNTSLGDAVNVQDLGRFLRDTDPHRNRWGYVELRFPSAMLRTVKKRFSSPAPNLERLSLSMTDAALPLNVALHEEIGRPLDILGGRSDKLQRVLLKNIPCVWDPSPFTAIIDLALMNGVHLHSNRLIDFLRHSSNLQSIRLLNIKFIGGGPQVLDERIPLPHLRVLVLAELIESVGLDNLFISLDAQNCVHTRLDIRPGGAAMIHPAFQQRVATTVKRVLALGKPSFLLFRSTNGTQGASWRSRDGGDGGRNEEDPSFEFSFRGAGEAFAGFFCDLVRRVRERIGEMGEMGEIVVDVGDTISGTIDEPLGLEDQIIPTLLPSLFAQLNVVEVRAVVVAGFLGLFKHMLGPVESEGWCFRALRTIRLRAIPPLEMTVLPDPSAQCSLDDLIDHIRREHDGIDLKEAKPEDGPAMTIALKGWFGIPTETGLALEKGDVLSGIKIDHTEATLEYVRVQEQGKEGGG
ncbi:hypothetical protein FS837_000583 [Tulasnella sp. UAMH 9824]|nr:hypothetical protein FS837_000583 [Tulasnella sp. UAMH 9824]